MLSINDRVNTGNVRGMKADVTTLCNLVERQMDQNGGYLPESLRRQYRNVILRNQLLRPQLQNQIGREADSYDWALLELAFGLPLSYQGYCQLEDLLGTGSPPDPPPTALLNTIRRAGMRDPRLASIVLSYLGEKRPKEWFDPRDVSIGDLVNYLAAPWDREHHAKIMCQALVEYLAAMPGKHKLAEVREALAPHDYLAPVLRARYGDDSRYQLKALQTFLTAAFGAKLGRGPVIDVLRNGEHAPTWALFGAVLTMLDPADRDVADLARELFFIGGFVKSGFGQDLEVRLLRYVSPEVAAAHAGVPDRDATQPIDLLLAGPARRPVGALPPATSPPGRGVTPAQPEPIFEPASSQPPSPSFESAQSQLPPPSQQPGEAGGKRWGGIFGGSKHA
jgi:hypothetical protein